MVARLNDDHKELNFSVIDRMKDEGFSGGTLNRPDMKLLITKVENKEFDVLLIYKMDRITRNLKDALSLIEILKNNGVDIVSCDDKIKIDTVSAMGKAFFAISMVFSELERSMASERIKDNNLQLAIEGSFMGGYLKLGHDVQRVSHGGKTKSILSVNEEEAIIVRDFFSKYLSGESFMSLAHYCNDNQIYKKAQPNPHVGLIPTYTDSNFKTILKDLNYAPNNLEMHNFLKNEGWEILMDEDMFDGRKSLQSFGKKIAFLDVPPIVTSETFINTQKIKKNRRSNLGNSRISKAILASGLARCAECGKGLGHFDVKRKRVSNKPYYCCHNNLDRCSRATKRIDGTTLEDYVLDYMKKRLSDVESVKKVISNYYGHRDNVSNLEVSRLKKAMSKNIKKIGNLTNMMLKAPNSPLYNDLLNHYQSEQLHLLQENDEMTKQLEAITESDSYVDDNVVDIQNLIEVLKDFGEIISAATPENIKTILIFMVDRIVVRSATDFDVFLKKSVTPIQFSDYRKAVPSGTAVRCVDNNQNPNMNR